MSSSKEPARSTLRVENFGPIAEATVELRPFTVFVGASNTGKSYLAILLYALHQFFGEWTSAEGRVPPSLLRRPLGNSTRNASTAQLRAARNWLQTLAVGRRESVVDVAVPDDIATLVRPILEDVGDLAPFLDSEVKRCFGVAEARSLIRQSSTKAARIAVRRQVGNAAEEQLSYDFTIAQQQSHLTASIPTDLPLRVQNGSRYFLRFARRILNDFDVGSRNTLAGLLADLIVPNTVGEMDRPIHYLPADRAGVMHAHRVVVSSLIGRASRAGFEVESPLPALSGVLADFLEQLISLDDGKRRRGASERLAKRLEAEVLGGAITNRKSAVGYPSFHYRPAQWENELPLMNTSSMVSELAPVVLYLRHVVRPGNVLIIEEPESHLHPAMQVSFTRLLAAVVQSGVRVVVTTHSEWVLETLANLVRLSEVSKQNRGKMAGGELALTPDQVGAWLFEQKQRPKGSVVKEIPLDFSRGTFPAGFSDITEQLYNDWAGIANLVAEQDA